MTNLGPAFVALIIAALVVLLELLTTEYPATYPLLIRSSGKLYIYGAIYGILAFILTLVLDELGKANILNLEGPGISSSWIGAAILGVSIKALLHIRLFSVRTEGNQSYPVGIETIVLLFEPWLLRGITIDHFNAVRRYIRPRSNQYTNLQKVKALIKGNLPSKFPMAERTAFLADIENTSNVIEAMELFISYLGVRSFDLVFPAKHRNGEIHKNGSNTRPKKPGTHHRKS